MKRRPWRGAGLSDEAAGARALADATRRGQVRAARFVLDALDGRPVNARGPEGHTPLMLAALLPDAAASVALVELLLRRGADPALEDRWGDSALIHAAASGNAGVLRSLVRAFARRGVELHRPNRDGHSALQVARWLGHADCVSVLSACGASTQRVEHAGARAAQVGEPPARVAAPATEGPQFKFARPVNFYGASSGGPLPDVLEEPSSTSFFPSQSSSSSAAASSSSDSSAAAAAVVASSSSSAAAARCGNPRAAARLTILRQQLNSMDSIEEEFDGDDASSGASGDSVPKTEPPVSRRECGLRELQTSALWVQDSRQSFLPVVSPPGNASKSPATAERCAARSQTVELPGSRCSLPEVLAHGEQVPSQSLGATKHLGQLLVQLGNCHVGDGVRRFNDSYYQKRSSLPCGGSLTAASPAEKLLPLRKGNSPAGLVNSRPSPFHALGTRLLRRLTAPEFARRGPARAPGAWERSRLEQETAGRVSRSDTDPVSNHKLVSSQPSVDSISSVKCEFDFQSAKNSKEP